MVIRDAKRKIGQLLPLTTLNLTTKYVMETPLAGANYISNVLVHPTAKLDYGFLNRYDPETRPTKVVASLCSFSVLLCRPSFMCRTRVFFDVLVVMLRALFFSCLPKNVINFLLPQTGEDSC